MVNANNDSYNQQRSGLIRSIKISRYCSIMIDISVTKSCVSYNTSSKSATIYMTVNFDSL